LIMKFPDKKKTLSVNCPDFQVEILANFSGS